MLLCESLSGSIRLFRLLSKHTWILEFCWSQNASFLAIGWNLNYLELNLKGDKTETESRNLTSTKVDLKCVGSRCNPDRYQFFSRFYEAGNIFL